MQPGYELSNKQEQRLIATPEMKQSLKILQFSSQELAEYIRTEIEANPLIELDDDCKYKTDYEHNTYEYLPVDWKEYFKSDQRISDNYDKHDFAYHDEDKSPAYEMIPENSTSLYEHLMLQLEMADISSFNKKVTAFLIRHIDDNGYLTISKGEAASILRTDRNIVSESLRLIQSFDPPGVGARSIRECLIIQLKHMGLLSDEIRTIVLEHLKDIAAGNYCAISKKCGLNIERVKEICNIIKGLEPKPGRPFARGNPVNYVVPDIIAEKSGNEYIVTVQDICAPRLKINMVYQNMLSNANMGPDVIQFLLGRLKSAYFIIRAIEHRRATIKKVAESIVIHEKDFFEKGILHLKPLTLKTISDDVKLHESTVSRAITGKYIQTPSGVYELKTFFDSGIANSTGNIAASQTIKRMINELIMHENPLKPYSDSEITKILQKKGYEISRRTVAKYREQLNLKNSSERKIHIGPN